MLFRDPCQRSLTCNVSTFSEDLSSEITGQYQLNFIRNRKAKSERKCIFRPRHMVKLASMSYMTKALNDLLLQKKKPMTLKLGIFIWDINITNSSSEWLEFHQSC